MKTCKDCKHLVEDTQWTLPELRLKYASCKRGTKTETNAVTGGEYVTRSMRCEQMREGRTWLAAMIFGLCGRSGRYWEPK